jgi:isochorismate hydrolase
MLKMLKKQYRQLYSIFSIFLMLFQSVAPAAFLVTPAYAATDAAVVTVSDVTLDFSEETNEFTLKGVASESTEFVLTYNDENDETPE